MAKQENQSKEPYTLNGGEVTRYSVGDKVIKDGYPGVVVRRYSEGMVEVRLQRGLVCVPDEDLSPR